MFNVRKNIIILSLLTPWVAPIIASKAPVSPTNLSLHAVTDIDKIIDEGQRQLTKIRICLSSISALIQKDPRYSKELQKQIMLHFIELDQTIIASLKHEKFIQIDLENAYILLQINNTIIDHINQLTNTNFKNLDTVNIQGLIQQSITTRNILQPDDILRRLISNDKKLNALMSKALGLTWYNKVTRFVDDWFIHPCQKYSLPQRALLCSSIIFLSSYLAWQMAHTKFRDIMVGTDNDHKELGIDQLSFFTKKTRQLYKTVYGPVPTKGASFEPEYPGQSPDEIRTLECGLIGKLDRMYFKWMHDLNGVGKLVVSLIAANAIFELKKTSPFLIKYWEITKNWLKGGSYLKVAEQAAEKAETVRFKDIYGQDEIKRYLQLIVDYLKEPETFDRLGLTPPKGILCIGDTRTGKTFMISALFGEINDMLKQTGQAGKFKLIRLDPLSIKVDGMETILRRVRQNAPCIVFIDEIDLLDLQRTGENRTLSEFLTAMSDALGSKDSKKQVIIIAATNRPETLDIALRQPGRFGKELRFEYPNYTDRCKFIQTRLQDLSLNSNELDIKKIAQYTENKSYEAINMLIKNAIIKARLRGEILTQGHLDEALDEDIYHIIPKYTKDIPEEELRILAAHFSGQALCLALHDNKINLAKVTIKQVMTELKEEVMGRHLYAEKQSEQQRFEYGRIFTHHKTDSININTRDEKLELCKMYLAGFIAEEILLGSCGYSCHAEDDALNALTLAQSIAFEGIDIIKMPKHIQKQKHEEALSILQSCKNEVSGLLNKHKQALQALAEHLLEHKTLDYDQVTSLVKKPIMGNS